MELDPSPNARAVRQVYLCQWPKDAECRALHILQELQDLGKLPGLIQTLDAQAKNLETSGKMSCHDTAFSLMEDLRSAGMSENWFWCYGYVWNADLREHIAHSWLEFDGWAADASYVLWTVMLMENGLFRAMCRAEIADRKSIDEARRLLDTPTELAEWCTLQDQKLKSFNETRICCKSRRVATLTSSKHWWEFWRR